MRVNSIYVSAKGTFKNVYGEQGRGGGGGGGGRGSQTRKEGKTKEGGKRTQEASFQRNLQPYYLTLCNNKNTCTVEPVLSDTVLSGQLSKSRKLL